MHAVQTDFLFERRLNDHLYSIVVDFSSGERSLQILTQVLVQHVFCQSTILSQSVDVCCGLGAGYRSLSVLHFFAGKPTLVFCRYPRSVLVEFCPGAAAKLTSLPYLRCMPSNTNECGTHPALVAPHLVHYTHNLPSSHVGRLRCLQSSRKGTQETASKLQQDAQRNGLGGSPSAFVTSPAQHSRLQVQPNQVIIVARSAAQINHRLCGKPKHSTPCNL